MILETSRYRNYRVALPVEDNKQLSIVHNDLLLIVIWNQVEVLEPWHSPWPSRRNEGVRREMLAGKETKTKTGTRDGALESTIAHCLCLGSRLSASTKRSSSSAELIKDSNFKIQCKLELKVYGLW